MLTQQRLKELFHYDPETGFFTRLVTRSANARKGMVAGTPSGHGYLEVRIDGRLYYLHTLAWLYTYGYYPELIDHDDRNGMNNKLRNLIEKDKSGNALNSNLHSDNQSGYKGVYEDKRTGKYVARLQGKHLGTFPTALQAHQEYIAAGGKA